MGAGQLGAWLSAFRKRHGRDPAAQDLTPEVRKMIAAARQSAAGAQDGTPPRAHSPGAENRPPCDDVIPASPAGANPVPETPPEAVARPRAERSPQRDASADEAPKAARGLFSRRGGALGAQTGAGPMRRLPTGPRKPNKYDEQHANVQRALEERRVQRQAEDLATRDAAMFESDGDGEGAARPEPETARPAPSRADVEALTRQDVEGMVVSDIKEYLRGVGLPVSGRKAELLERLVCAAEEGLEVALAEHAPQKARKKKDAVVGIPGGNFVRLNTKRKWKSSRKGRAPKPGKWSKPTAALAQAGVGVNAKGLHGVTALEGVEATIARSGLDPQQVLRRGTCFRCGGAGHWADDCPLGKEGGPPPRVPVGPNGAPRPPSAQHPLLRRGPAPEPGINEAAAVGVPGDDAGAKWIARTGECGQGGVFRAPALQPASEELLGCLRDVFGHEGFRPGQEEVVRRVLSLQPTMAVMPTGSGKSLLYQLPAALLAAPVVVLSPLTALMRDQLRALPAALPGAMITGQQPRSEVEQIIQRFARGHIKLLYLSPERLQSTVFRRALAGSSVRPAVVVVDEAHCVTEWGVNFRPAYLRLGSLIRDVLQPQCTLALTATATRAAEQAALKLLGLPRDCATRCAPVPPNLRLMVRRVDGDALGAQMRQAILWAMKHGELKDHSCIIVYTLYQHHADQIAALLSAGGVTALPYHAGRRTDDRLLVERRFREGHLRVVVATVAFGMGVDLSRVTGVVHAGMPRSMEEYVQQVGRAGRSGREGVCVLLLSDAEFVRSRSLAFSDGVERACVEEMLRQILADDGAGAGRKRARDGGCRWRVLALDGMCEALDAKREVIETVTAFLEVREPPLLTVHPPCSEFVEVMFFGDPEALAARHPVLTAVLNICPRSRNGRYKVAMAALVAETSAAPHDVLKELADAAGVGRDANGPAGGDGAGGAESSAAGADGVRFELTGGPALVYRLARTAGDDVDPQEVSGEVFGRMRRVESGQVARLDALYRVAAAAAREADASAQEALVREQVGRYFDEAAPSVAPDSVADVSAATGPAAEARLAGLPLQRPGPILHADIRAFLDTRPELVRGSERGKRARKVRATDAAATPRAVARIFHGLGSPAYPAKAWWDASEWKRWAAVDFVCVVEAARQELALARRRMRERGEIDEDESSE
ncbi:unnamed protein product [Pedinophyceae sp. YPF-701]|nr:unnamed protein product [Pedinophyceae sp. YPF-701]